MRRLEGESFGEDGSVEAEFVVVAGSVGDTGGRGAVGVSGPVGEVGVDDVEEGGGGRLR